MITHSYITPKVKVSRSGINRKGVFCVRPLTKGEIICCWGGYIITKSEYGRLKRSGFKNIEDYATVIADGLFLISSRQGRLEDDDFFNHSCEPNAGIKGQVMMAAMRDIDPGEEITYDYCMTDAGFSMAFSCHCGAGSCRKKVTSSDWKDPHLQKKYKGYFSWYVQSLIDKERIS